MFLVQIELVDLRLREIFNLQVEVMILHGFFKSNCISGFYFSFWYWWVTENILEINIPFSSSFAHYYWRTVLKKYKSCGRFYFIFYSYQANGSMHSLKLQCPLSNKAPAHDNKITKLYTEIEILLIICIEPTVSFYHASHVYVYKNALKKKYDMRQRYFASSLF